MGLIDTDKKGREINLASKSFLCWSRFRPSKSSPKIRVSIYLNPIFLFAPTSVKPRLHVAKQSKLLATMLVPSNSSGQLQAPLSNCGRRLLSHPPKSQNEGLIRKMMGPESGISAPVAPAQLILTFADDVAHGNLLPRVRFLQLPISVA